jgi:4,5-dihydroxyphthalate decarboxylase
MLHYGTEARPTGTQDVPAPQAQAEGSARMAKLRLRTALRTQGSTAALKDGTVASRHFSLDFEEVPVIIDAFRRMVRELSYDVSEMAFTTYLCAREHGTPITALPAFLVRGFHHGAIVTSASHPVGEPAELEGRKVGVSRGYTVTTGVWARGILADDYAVDLSGVTWVRSGDEHVAAYRPPANVISQPGISLADAVEAGELAAAVGITADRPGLVPLIPDAEQAGYRALRERGYYPINHVVVVRDELLDRHPGLAAGLMAVFVQAKDRYVGRLGNGEIPAPGPADIMYRRVLDITGSDPLPYGLAPNRPMIEQLIGYAVSQQILAGPPTTSGLFADGTDDVTA